MGNIVQNIFESFALLVQKGVAYLMALFTQGFVDGKFTPTIDYFNNTLFNGNLTIIMKFFAYAGYLILISLLAVHAVLTLMGNLIEQKNSLTTLLLRSVICLFLIAYGPTLMNAILDTGNSIYQKANVQFGIGVKDGDTPAFGQLEQSSSFKPITDAFKDEKISVVDVATENAAVAATGGLAITLLRLLLQVVLFAIVLYNYLKLLAELIKRYMTMMALYMTFPAICPFMVSATTVNIFFSFVSMFATEIGMIVLLRIWISLSLFLMGNIASDLIGCFVMIAFLSLGRNIDSLMRSLGFSTSSTGGALLDTVAATGVAVAMMSRGVGRVGGKALISGGARTGNFGMVAAGSALSGKPLTAAGMRTTADSSIGGLARSRDRMKNNLSNLTNSEAKNMMQTLTKGGREGSDAFQTAFNDLSSGSKKDFMNRLKNEKFSDLQDSLGEGNVLSLDQYDRSKGLHASIVDEEGNPIREGWISDANNANKESIPFNDNDGNSKYLNLEKANLEKVTTSQPLTGFKVDENGNSLGISKAELRTGINASDFLSPSQIKSGNFTVVPNGKGVSIYDNDSKHTVGHVTNDGRKIYSGKNANGSNKWSHATIAGESRDSAFESMFQTVTTGGDGSGHSYQGKMASLGYKNVKVKEWAPSSEAVTFSYTDSYGKENECVAILKTNNLDTAKGDFYGDKETGSFSFHGIKKKSEKK